VSPRELVPFVDLRRSYLSAQPAIDAAIRAVLESGRFVLAEHVQGFETAFASYAGVDHAIGVASGTDALHLALRAAGVGPGDEVITVANAGVPPVTAITMAGAVPVFVDIEPEPMTMSPTAAAAAVTSRTRAILPVHLYGRCADLGPILDLAHRHGLRVIEDCAQAAGTAYGGVRAGTFGDAGCFSFYPTKNLAAMGDGGMVVTRDAELARRVRLYRNYGEVARYDHVLKGFNSRLDELQAAILLARLPGLDEANARRRAIAAVYRKGLGSTGIRLPPPDLDNGHVYHLFVVRVSDRERFRAALSERGVTTLVHYPTPVPRQRAYAEYASALRQLPETERACAEVVSLPMFPELSDSQIETVIEACVEVSRCERTATDAGL
jgi:dTDP-4-amino-4,6-dideoxygalactose transaminase